MRGQRRDARAWGKDDETIEGDEKGTDRTQERSERNRWNHDLNERK